MNYLFLHLDHNPNSPPPQVFPSVTTDCKVMVWFQLMVKQEIYRKLGYGIQADEEQLRVQLEALMAELSAPMQFKVGIRSSLLSHRDIQASKSIINPSSASDRIGRSGWM